MDVQLPHAEKKGELELMATKHTVYISGPMTGLPEFNYPAFHEAEARLRALGHEVINPAVTGDADTSHIDSPTWHDYMASAVKQMERSTALHQLPGWWRSFGAWIERVVAWKMRLERVGLSCQRK